MKKLQQLVGAAFSIIAVMGALLLVFAMLGWTDTLPRLAFLPRDGAASYMPLMFGLFGLSAAYILRDPS